MSNQNQILRAELLNMVLVAVSLGLAVFMPFEIFLIAYAILGPLHYLTEINWLDNKGYFIKEKNLWLTLGSVLVLLITGPEVIRFFSNSEIGFLNTIEQYAPFLIIVSLFAAFVLVLIKDGGKRIIAFAIGAFAAQLLFSAPAALTVLGILIPTVIHVFLFTALFMIYGAAKNKSGAGILTVLLLLSGTLFTLFVDTSTLSFEATEWAKSSFGTYRFEVVNNQVAQMLGISNLGSNYFSNWGMRIQTFIAFIYIHHYLNWFAKTAVIGWHKGVNNKRALSIIGIWVILCAIFAFDYRVGFFCTISLSFLHVILEFPLNAVSIKGIFVELKALGSN